MPPPERVSESDVGKPKQPLSIRMYFDPCYTELTRFIGYGGKSLSEAQQFLLQLEKQYGRQKVIDAGEAVSVAEGKQENISVRLTAEARRLAWQLLGPPPEHRPTDMIADILAAGDRLKADPTPPKQKKPRRKRTPTAAMPAARAVEQAPAPLPEESRGSAATTRFQQAHREAKERHPGMLLLFRMGDFYEMFNEDAKTAASVLGVTLTTRDRTTPMAGFPHHSLETYLRKLIQAGHRVAICDEVEMAHSDQHK